MDINVYCYACNSSLEVVEEYNEGYPFGGVTVKVNPCPDCAAQQSAQADGALICPDCDFEFDYPICGKCGNGQLQPRR